MSSARAAKGEALIVDHKPTFGGRGGGTRSAIKRDKASRPGSARRAGLDTLVDSMVPAERDALLLHICRACGVTTPQAVREALGRLLASAACKSALETFIGSVTQIVERDRTAQRRNGPSQPTPQARAVPRPHADLRPSLSLQANRHPHTGPDCDLHTNTRPST